MTDWDRIYMNKPTNTDTLYPDPWGHLDKLEEERVDRTIRACARAATVVIAALMCVPLYAAWEWFHP